MSDLKEWALAFLFVGNAMWCVFYSASGHGPLTSLRYAAATMIVVAVLMIAAVSSVYLWGWLAGVDL